MSSEQGTGATPAVGSSGTTGSAQRSAEDMKKDAAAQARATGETIKQEAKAVGDQASELGREHAERRFEQGKQSVEGQVGAMGDALGDAARRLREENSPLASYADELSGQLSQLSRGIENSTLDDVAVKTRRLARENPGMFIMGSMVAGLAAARFFKASAERERHESGSYGGGARDGYGASGYGAGSVGGEYRSPIARGDGSRPDATSAYRDPLASPSSARVPMDSTASTATPSTTTPSPTSSAATARPNDASKPGAPGTGGKAPTTSTGV